MKTTDAPQLYAIRLVSRGPRVACRLWYGPVIDPVTGEELDRGHHWQCLINGEHADAHDIAIFIGDEAYVKGEMIDQAEHDYLVSVYKWALVNAPNSPEANPRRAIDINEQPPVF